MDVLDSHPLDPLNGWDLREAGADGVFGNEDDDVYDLRVSPGYSGGTTVNLRLFDGPMHEGQYRLMLTPSLADPVGNLLDGDGDGVGGDAFTRTFHVDLPEGFVYESRSNNSRSTATPLPLVEDPVDSGYYLGHGLGSIDPAVYNDAWNESDYWSFEAQAGDRVAVAVGTPNSGLNPYVYLYNASGNSLTGDDDAGPGSDAYISHYTVPTDGTYYARVGHYRYSGTVGNYQLRVELARGIDLESDAGYHNDSIAQADVVALETSGTHRNGQMAGTVMAGESGNVDEDYFDLGTVEAGETVLARLFLPESSTLQPVLEIRDASNQVVSITPNPTDETVVRVDISETGTYYAVALALDGEGHFGQYLLDATIAPTSELQFADLSVTDLVAPSDAFSGEDIHLEWVVGNFGTAETDTDTWYDRAVLSLNKIYADEDDVPFEGVDSVQHTGILGAGGEYALPANGDFRVPKGLSGEYWILVKADATGRVFEFNLEDNNVGISDEQIVIRRPPQVISHEPAGYSNETFSTITLTLSSAVEGEDARNANTYRLLNLGPDRTVGGDDDVEIAVTPIYLDGTTQIELGLGESLAEGAYQLTAFSGEPGLRDPGGASLDGDGDGVGGGDFVATFVIDTTAPGAVGELTFTGDTGASNSDGLTNDETPTFSWTAPFDAGGISHYEYQVDGGTWTALVPPTVTVTLAAGAHDFAVRAVDNAGLTGPESSIELTIDLTAPARLGGLTLAEDTGPLPDDGLTADSTPTFSWQAADEVDFWTYQYRLDGGPWTDTGDPTSPTITLAPGQGGHTFSVRSVDLAGNPGLASEAFGFTIDTTMPPSPASVSIADDTGASESDRITNDNTLTVSWPAVTDPSGVAYYQYQIDGMGWVDQTVTSVDLNPSPGAHGFDVRAVDGAGNIGMARSATIVVDQQPPTVVSHEPGGTSAEPVGHVDVTFDEVIDLATLSPALTLYHAEAPVTDPGFVVSELGGGTYRIAFTPLMLNGLFRLEIAASAADLAGNPMGADYEAAFSQAVPDLAAVSVAPATTDLQFGQTAQVSWTVENRPAAGQADGSWNDAVYLSDDAVLDGGDMPLGSWVGPGSLAPGADYTSNVEIALPLSIELTACTYYLIVKADHEDVLVELDESNNTAASTLLNITLPPTADLTVADVAPVGALIAGQEATFVWTVHNQGDADATSVWSEEIFVSLDDTVGDDVLLGTVTFSGTVPANSSEARSATLTIPQTFSHTGTVYLVVATDTADDVFESDEDNNAAASLSSATLADSLAITASTTAVAETAGSNVLRFVVTRSGSVSAALTVDLQSSDTTEVAVPATVTIPAGQQNTAFFAEVLDDTIVDPSQVVTVTASAAGFVSDTADVGVLDDETPSLGIDVPVQSMGEGETVTATVSRSYGMDEDPAYMTDQPLTVTLVDVSGGQFTMPSTVEIPAGSLEATFELTATDDEIPEANALHEIDATASGYLSGTAGVTVEDDDLPTLTIIPAWAEVSEGAGATALTAIVQRAEATGVPLTVRLRSSDTTAAVVPPQVIIPAGETNASFVIGAVDDEMVDGTQLAVISAAGVIPNCNQCAPDPTGTATADIEVLDDDGPTLTVTFDRELVNEGVAAAANLTVSRNT